MWPIKDIPANDAIYRDFLRGISEKKFRSARLHTWFDTPENYFTEELENLRKKKASMHLQDHTAIQENQPLRGSLSQEVIHVFTDDESVSLSLTDPKF